MKTTIDLPEDLLRRAKITAAERKTTLKELVIEGLTRVTDQSSEAQKAKREEAMRRLVENLAANNTEPMVPLTREEIYNRGRVF